MHIINRSINFNNMVESNFFTIEVVTEIYEIDFCSVNINHEEVTKTKSESSR